MNERDRQPDETPDAPPRRRPRQQLSSMQIVFAAILSIGLLLVINLSGRIARGQQMDAEYDRLQATISVLELQKIDLLQEHDYAASDSAVEQWAHSDGKMVREGEHLVIPIPGQQPTPTPTPAQAPATILVEEREPEQSQWELWWQLFFDGAPPF